ncbi:MAG: GHKL domain-containing protein [Lachnospiraceae bacterium]|nr:GHKL domain-containing protein [Lachnospiraceae bacterium]
MIILFILELIALISTFYFLFGSDLTNNSLKKFMACFLILIFGYFIFLDIFVVPFTFFLFLILYFLFEEKLYYIFSMTAICTLIEMVAGYSCIVIIYMATKDVNREIFFLSPLLDSCLYILEIFFSIAMKKKRKSRARFLHEIDSKGYWFLFAVSLFSVCFISLAEVFLYSEIDKTGYYYTALSFMIAITVMLFVTSVITIVLRRYNIKLQHINYLKQRCLDLEQANYFESKSRDEKLRAFRHDFNSHILALRNLADLKEWDKLNQYIHQLSIDKNSFNLYNISTGNVTADAIINHFQHSLEDDIVFKIDGQFRKECFVEEMDICIIFSNLLNNAHEAFEYIDKNRAKEIYLSIAEDSGKMVFMVENTSKPYSLKELEHLQTVKADKLNHGFGLFNVQQVSEKYHGELLVKFSEGFFITTVVLYNR